MDKKNLVILGSTGSIGKQALEIVDKYPDKYRVVALAGNQQVDLLIKQAKKYQPQVAVLARQPSADQLSDIKKDLGATEIFFGVEGMRQAAGDSTADIVLTAVSGAVGILPTIAAIKAGKRIALANKETLVAAGSVVMPAAQHYRAEIIPVDSEHSAVFQCLQGEKKFLANIWLTASGGPFRGYTKQALEQVTLKEALKHPNWHMGAKITIDSATMMNKGLEVIEAHHLFAADYDNIKVIIQKESIVHSMVQLSDGSFLANLGSADMRLPIQYAFTYPERQATPAKPLNFYDIESINFAKPDTEVFPALNLAYAAGRTGGTMPAVMNAANEMAVRAFLREQIAFHQIIDYVQAVMETHSIVSRPDLEDILSADTWARKQTEKIINQRSQA